MSHRYSLLWDENQNNQNINDTIDDNHSPFIKQPQGRPGPEAGHWFDPRVRQHSFVEIGDHW